MSIIKPKVNISDKHLTFSSSNAVKNACTHLFTNSSINIFYHGEIFANGKTSLVTTIPEFNQYVYANGLMPMFGTPEVSHGIHYLPSSRNSALRAELGKRFNIDNVIEFAELKHESVEVVGFGTSCNVPNMTNYYFNNLEVLKQFILDFKDRAASLIIESYSHAIIVPQPDICDVDGNNYVHGLRKALSQREKEVLLSIYNGLSAKQTASLLDLSTRTVEYYINCVKRKLGMRKKTELIKYAIQNNILNH